MSLLEPSLEVFLSQLDFFTTFSGVPDSSKAIVILPFSPSHLLKIYISLSN